MDTGDTGAVNLTTILLQWSHGFSAMDTRAGPPCHVVSIVCFNGATAFQPWIQRPPRTLVPQGFPDPFSSGPQQRQKIDLIFPSPAALNSLLPYNHKRFERSLGVAASPRRSKHTWCTADRHAAGPDHHGPITTLQPAPPGCAGRRRRPGTTSPRGRVPNHHRGPAGRRSSADHPVVDAALRRHPALHPFGPAVRMGTASAWSPCTTSVSGRDS